MKRANELTILAFCLCCIAAVVQPGCKRVPRPEPKPEPVVVAPYSVDLAFEQYRKAWAVVALAAAEQAESGMSEVDVNAWAKPRKEAALQKAFAVLAEEMDARLDNPATPEQYAAAMREMAYLADPTLKAK